GGHSGKVKADLRWLRLADGDRLLLCSDGLSEMVDDDAIARILAEREPPDAAQVLLDAALDGGGKGNVTVIVARDTIPTPQSPAGPRVLEKRPGLASTSEVIAPALDKAADRR